jgi:hypothetical protein
MPFPTGLLFSHPALIASVALYAGTAAAMGLSLALLWSYAVRRRFLAPGLSGALRRDILLNLLLPPPGFSADHRGRLPGHGGSNVRLAPARAAVRVPPPAGPVHSGLNTPNTRFKERVGPLQSPYSSPGTG